MSKRTKKAKEKRHLGRPVATGPIEEVTLVSLSANTSGEEPKQYRIYIPNSWVKRMGWVPKQKLVLRYYAQYVKGGRTPDDQVEALCYNDAPYLTLRQIKGNL